MIYRVRLAKDTRTGKEVVVKYYKDTSRSQDFNKQSKELIVREKMMLKQCKGPGVIEFYNEPDEVEIPYKKSTANFHYIVLEHLSGETLHDIINKLPMDEQTACFIFVKIMKIIERIHSAGVAHLNLRPENIMIDSSGHFKIIDFGLAADLAGDDGEGKIKHYNGKSCYNSPQIVSKVPYTGYSADAFALGVILFAMVCKMEPFDDSSSNSAYSLFYTRSYEKYWKSVESQTKMILSAELQSLLTGLFIYEPHERLTVVEALSHEWVTKNNTLSEEDMRNFIKKQCAL